MADVAGPRVALVLGAGGPVGHAFHCGALKALEESTGWDAARAELIVGTSAGAQVAALIRAGLSADDRVARVTGEPLSAPGRAIARRYARPNFGKKAAGRRFTPAAPGYLGRSLLTPWRSSPGRFIAALLPEGRVSLSPMAEGIGGLFEGGWPTAPLWICAVDLDSGQRIIFGKPGQPETDVGTAVTCSSAVPGLVTPVQVAGARFIDGGMAGLTNLDVVLDEPDVDLIVIVSPLSMFFPIRWLMRRRVAKLRARGVSVVLIEPSHEAQKAMGFSTMDTRRGPSVAEAAYRSVLRWAGETEWPLLKAARPAAE